MSVERSEGPSNFETDPNFGGLLAQQASDSLESESESKVVKICKQCMVSQSGQAMNCAQCGSDLVPIRTVQDSYVGELIGGRFKVVEQIGVGGMGEVYLGVNTPIGQRVAIKFLSRRYTSDESVIMRFLNEARSYCKVSHPNAVTLLEYGQHSDGSLYLITEYIDGKNLADTLRESGPLPANQVISIAVQMCEVLSAAHRQGVIHRDLKPDNIMLIPVGRGRFAVKVLDFGIAKIIDDDLAPMTETGAIFGTPEFMSPEQAMGESSDPRSDLYAMGIVMFYALTGKLPFRGDNKLAVLNKHLHEQAPRPSSKRADLDIPPALEAIIMKCLNKRPDERYATADELAQALEELHHTKDVSKTAPQRPSANVQKHSVHHVAPEAVSSENSENIAAANTNTQTIHWGESDLKSASFDLDMISEDDYTLGDESLEFDAEAENELPRISITLDTSNDSELLLMPEQRMKAWQGRRLKTARLKNITVAALVLFSLGAVAVWKVDMDEMSIIPASLISSERQTSERFETALVALDELLLAGDLAAAQQLLGEIESLVVSLDDSDAAHARFDEKNYQIKKADSNLEKLEAALSDRECDTARSLASDLYEISPGMKGKVNPKLDTCAPIAPKSKRLAVAQERPTSKSPAPAVATRTIEPKRKPEATDPRDNSRRTPARSTADTRASVPVAKKAQQDETVRSIAEARNVEQAAQPEQPQRVESLPKRESETAQQQTKQSLATEKAEEMALPPKKL